MDDIKNRIQEQINITLDMRAIEQVIVTDLAVTRVGKVAPLTTATSGEIAFTRPKDGPAGDIQWDTAPPQ